MSGFSLDWLNLREPADHRARDQRLLRKALDFIESSNQEGKGKLVLDLGTGTGSTFRAFRAVAERSLKSQTWRLVDNDPVLLKEATRRLENSVTIETFLLDLNKIPELPLAGAGLVTSSALFDLVSADFVSRLVSSLHMQNLSQPPAFYSALNYDGSTDWERLHPMDQAVLRAFNADQRTDKGFGPALGPDASSVIEQEFRALGFTVLTADSPWELDGSDERLVTELINGISNAVSADSQLGTEDVAEWRKFRLKHAGDGACRVGHTDLLALPANPASSESEDSSSV